MRADIAFVLLLTASILVLACFREIRKSLRLDLITAKAFMASEDEGFTDLLKDLDKSVAEIVVRMEVRKSRKPVTLVEGIQGTADDLERVTHELKKRLSTGGTAKGGQILLQGDQRDKVKEELVKMGYSKSNIVLY